MRKRFGSTLVSLPLSAAVIFLSFTLMMSVVDVDSLGAIRLAATSGPVFDDFTGPAGSAPNSQYWTIDPASTAGWANGEVGTYTDSPDNIRLDGQDHLVIQALSGSTGYTTARVNTLGKVNMLYGRVEARIKLPAGYAIWPAFWLLGSNNPTVGWPQCGELDIAEMVSDDSNFHVSAHGPQNPQESYPDGFEIGAWPPSPIGVSQDFHIYWANRQFNYMQVGIDDTTLATYTPASLPEGAQWVFSAPMYAILNVAVGSKFTGPPNDSTSFPATMLVDWFRYTPWDDGTESRASTA
jgi:beta-glucanase (GH16 family)